MTRSINIEELLTLHGHIPIADVRTPAEFAHGHIPQAVNLPIFTNEERISVGTAYKQKGREAAILLGFDLTGSKWSGFIKDALTTAPDKKIALHCWRGGMRSAAMAWALDLYGFEVFTLRSGYKAYRHWTQKQFQRSWPLTVIGGMTGSGKTHILSSLKDFGEQTIDLEELAQHRGSTYGSLNRLIQPTQEQFENDLAKNLSTLDPNKTIWIEDESQNIGRCLLPKPIWTNIRTAPLFDLQVPLEQRIVELTEEYGGLDKDFLVECTERISRRLGPERSKNAIAAIHENRMPDFIRQVLVYYDKTYRKGIETRDPNNIIPVPAATCDATQNAANLLAIARNTHNTIPT